MWSQENILVSVSHVTAMDIPMTVIEELENVWYVYCERPKLSDTPYIRCLMNDM